MDRQKDVSSFFWRQVVANSPHDSSPSSRYERGWGAINELIRSDSSWNGYERNNFFANNNIGARAGSGAVIALNNNSFYGNNTAVSNGGQFVSANNNSFPNGKNGALPSANLTIP